MCDLTHCLVVQSRGENLPAGTAYSHSQLSHQVVFFSLHLFNIEVIQNTTIIVIQSLHHCYFRMIMCISSSLKLHMTQQFVQGSLVFPRTPLVVDTGNSRMAARNVDENIYHWKILNVSTTATLVSNSSYGI